MSQQLKRRLAELGERINTLRTEQEFILDESFRNGHRIPRGRDLARVAQIDRIQSRLDAEWCELKDQLKGGE